MNLLLDTHIALRAIIDDPRLPVEAHTLIADLENDVFVSAASVWEIAVKHGLAGRKRAAMPVSGSDALAFFRRAGYRLLPMTADHAAAIETLPQIHADPFDRMIVAQALVEPLRLITCDSTVAAYSDTILRV